MTAGTGPDPARTITLDAHVHTDASYDCATPPERVVEAALSAGLDAVAVTDHDVVDGARRAVAAAAGTDLLVVPGVEVSTGDGHLLALGVDWAPEPGRPFAETVEAVRQAGGVAVVPHPFQISRHGVRRAVLTGCEVDGIETRNAVAVTGYQNRRARQFAAAEGHPAVGGSDAHRPTLIGRAFTSVTLPAGVDWTTMTVADVLSGIRGGAATAQGTVTTPVEFGKTYAWHARDTAATALDSAGTAAANGRTAAGAHPALGVGAVLGSALLFGSRGGRMGRVPRRIAGRVR
ncbi:PHP domain-containing protein [Halosimplex carlsbadense 2-9-1]|uniref:PHP domain-containing protein n=1 Tax=Halosimplex carlsbadense 2-9-1 TaxID=797114 RepID=M0D2C3_9EURY|nr:PHP domain-containing protein [Halosimplex carlsbadense]ELZ28847.1 PHP domain-containing protein [Halosimplex carlsbadense 2-9-1]